MNLEQAIIQSINKLADFLRVQCFGGIAAVSDLPVTHPLPHTHLPPFPPSSPAFHPVDALSKV